MLASSTVNTGRRESRYWRIALSLTGISLTLLVLYHLHAISLPGFQSTLFETKAINQSPYSLATTSRPADFHPIDDSSIDSAQRAQAAKTALLRVYRPIPSDTPVPIKDNFPLAEHAHGPEDLPPIPPWNVPPPPESVKYSTPLFIGFTRGWLLL